MVQLVDGGLAHEGRGRVEKGRDVREHNPAPSDTTTALAGVNVVYCAEEAQARRLLAEMVGAGRVAIDIETAPNKTEIDRLAKLLHAKAETAGTLKAKRKLKAPPNRARGAGRRRQAPRRRDSVRPGRLALTLTALASGFYKSMPEAAGLLSSISTIPAMTSSTLLDGVSVIAHNVAFELAFLEKAGVALGELQCTLQATRLMLGEKATSLAAAAATYLNLDLDKTQQTSDWNAPHLSRQQIDYAAIDAVVAWRIAEKILPRFDVQRSAYEIQLNADPRSDADGAARVQARRRSATRC